ncbi:MAG: hypothetical protein PHC66_04740 [Candidatus Nanoarchaeia archaeon]|nr:hypothetical protein [Candidatus Nanoarchaeia archaeon]MDD5238990.1 hypothetical protein [Candidatus Nanoarchaeia archaeon]
MATQKANHMFRFKKPVSPKEVKKILKNVSDDAGLEFELESSVTEKYHNECFETHMTGYTGRFKSRDFPAITTKFDLPLFSKNIKKGYYEPVLYNLCLHETAVHFSEDGIPDSRISEYYNKLQSALSKYLQSR